MMRFWFDLGVDAAASMLYRDYSRRDGEWALKRLARRDRDRGDLPVPTSCFPVAVLLFDRSGRNTRARR